MMKNQGGKAVIAIILMLLFAGAAYLIMTMFVMDKKSDEAGDVAEVETRPGEVSIERANQIVQKTKKTLAGQKKALDDRLKKNLGQ